MIAEFKEILYNCTKDFALAEDVPPVDVIVEELYSLGWDTKMVNELCRRLRIIWDVYNRYNVRKKGYEVPVLGRDEFNLAIASVGAGEGLRDFVENLAYSIKKKYGIDVDVGSVLGVREVKGSIEKYVKPLELVDEHPSYITIESAARRKWNEWDMIREFVQNALDASGKAEVVRIDEGLLISDKGGGFDATAFLVGESTKDPRCDRGQFGDGMKMACATALLYRYGVWIHTKGYVFKAVVRPKMFKVEEEVEEGVFVEKEVPKDVKESNSVDFLQAQQEVLLDIMHVIANREVRVPKE